MRPGAREDCLTRVGTTSDREADPRMHRLLAASLTVAAGALLALGAALGIVALLDATPDQPNTPLVHYEAPARGQ